MEILSTYVFPERRNPTAEVDLKEFAIEAFYAPNRSIGPEISSVDASFFMNSLCHVWDETGWDPYHREANVQYLYDRKKDEVTETSIGRGSRNSTTVYVETTSVGGVPTQIVLGGIHSHPSGDSRPSVYDLTRLLLPTTEFGASGFSMIASRKSNLVIFRGRNSPQLPFEELEAGKKMINHANGISSFFTLGRGLSLGEALRDRMAQDYDLQFFQGARGSAVLHRKLTSQLSA